MALYGFSAGVTGANSIAYFSLNFSAGTFDSGGSADFLPSSASYSYADIGKNYLTMYTAPGDASIGGPITASTNIAGSILVSPAVNVPTVITVYGRGTVLGTYTLPAGQSNGNFNINVSANEAFEDAAAASARAVPNKKPQ